MPPEMVVNAPINQVVDGRNVLDRLARVVVTASAQTAAQTKPTPPIVVDGAVVEEMRGPGCGTTKIPRQRCPVSRRVRAVGQP
jgi:hypothetical protein